MWRIGMAMTALALCAACGSRDEEVIRYVVAAEVAERTALPPSRVEVTVVSIEDGGAAMAEANYAPLATRGPERTRLRCRLTHRTARWQVEDCAEAE